MAADSDIRRNDSGTVIRVTITDNGTIVNLTGATVVLKFRRKDKTVFEVPGIFETDGADGIVTYTSGSADFDQVGEWKIQAKVTNAEGTWHSDIMSFSVGEILTVT